MVAVGDVDVRHETRSCPVGTTFTISAGELGKRVSKQHEEELGREERYQKLLARTATMSITTNSVPATEFSNAVLRRRIGRCGWVEVASPEKKRTCYLKPGAEAVLVAGGEIEQLYYYLSPRVDPALSTCYPGEEFSSRNVEASPTPRAKTRWCGAVLFAFIKKVSKVPFGFFSMV